MPKRIVLLTGEVEAEFMTRQLCAHHADMRVDTVTSRDELDAAFAEKIEGTRLIAALTGVVVPAHYLDMLEGPAYNFHPGPPEFPGSFAASFAIYDGAKTFGVTLHEMAPKVDSGSIVEVRRFEVPGNAKFQDLEITAFETIIQMFNDYVAHLATNDEPLPHSDEVWTGRNRTKAEAAKLKQIESDLSEEEIVLRYRAFG